jgi:hypothetical protein
MKNAVSYVSGTGGDFLVNCCNQMWSLGVTQQGCAVASASTKKQENQINDREWLELINNSPFQYVGTHQVDRLLRLPVAPIWLTVPNINEYYIWARRDCVTRNYKKLLSPSGDMFENIKDLVISNQSKKAANIYLDWITKYNWVLMQTREVQASNKINVSRLLTKNGIDEIIDQMPQLKQVAVQCQSYHTLWLAAQFDLTESSVINLLSEKLCKFIKEIE